MKTFFNYVKRLKLIRRNLRIYYYTMYDRKSYVERNILFYYVLFFLNYFITGLSKRPSYFSVHLNKEKTTKEIQNEIFERMEFILKSNGFNVPAHITSYNEFTFGNIKENDISSENQFILRITVKSDNFKQEDFEELLKISKNILLNDGYSVLEEINEENISVRFTVLRNTENSEHTFNNFHNKTINNIMHTTRNAFKDAQISTKTCTKLYEDNTGEKI